MALAHPPQNLPSTAPLRLTPKSPRTPSTPSPFSSYPPISIISVPPTPTEDHVALSNPRRAPTPPSIPKRMKSTPLLQLKEASPRENNNTMGAPEGPIVAPSKTRQTRVSRLSGRLGDLVLSTRKGRPTSSAESAIRIEVTSSRIFSATKTSPTSPETLMERNTPSPASPAKAPRRRWPFTSSSFWPRPTVQSPISESSASSPRDSSDTSMSSQEGDDLASEEDTSSILHNTLMSSHQRSTSVPLLKSPTVPRPIAQHSLSTPTPEKPADLTSSCTLPTITVTLPSRTSLAVSEQDSGRERTLSELFEGLFILSSGGKTASTVSLSTVNERLDVPEIASEQEEDDFDATDLISPGDSSFEACGELLEPPTLSLPPLRRRSSAPSSMYEPPVSPPIMVLPTLVVTPPLSPEEDVPRVLHTKRSSSALPLMVAHVDRTIVIPSAPCSPIHEGVSPIQEETQDDVEVEEHAIYISNDDFGVSMISDDQWTLRAESIVTETARDELPQNRLPRYSQLQHSPSQLAYHQSGDTVVNEQSEPQTSLSSAKAILKSDLFTPPKTPEPVFNPPPRLTSLELPPARRLRSLLRADIASDGRASQQWDREKVTQDVRQVVQRLRWDKAQKAWQLVREAEHLPPAHGRINSVSQTSSPHRPIPLSPTFPTRTVMLPPGKMEWALVDSATPSNTGPGLVFRLCIAWRVTPEHNAVRHPFGAQEELKVFVLGRNSEDFYQLYEGLMGRFMLEPRRHPWAQPHEIGPKAAGSIEPMELPVEEEEDLDFTSEGARWEAVREIVRRKVDTLDAWTQGFMNLKHTNMAHVLESDFVRGWMAPRREGDCERSVDKWRKDGHGEIGRDSEGIANVLERLW